MNSKVDFATFCCPKDIRRLAAPGELYSRVRSHLYHFDNVFVVRQRCRGEFDDVVFSSPEFAVTELCSEDYPDILTTFGIKDDPKADEMTHGPTAPHYWKWHVINHLIVSYESKADYIVFSDADCRILKQFDTWIDVAIRALSLWPQILIVSPSDGGTMAEMIIGGFHGGLRLTQNISQQMFIVNRNRFLSIDFDDVWNGIMDAPGGPFQEYYYLLEGRLWRYMKNHGLYRAILPDKWRYWHDQWH